MREVKYRAWVKEYNCFLPVFDIDFHSKIVGVWDCGEEDCGLCDEYLFFHEVEIVEYTGLKDKNGVEIFDGAIVRFSERTINGAIFTHICQVYQHKSGFWQMEGTCTVGGVKLPKTNMGLYSNLSRVEVIGNRFENPDLLGGAS